MADINLKAFMVDTLKNKEDIIDFPGLDTFKDKEGNPMPIKVRALNRARINEIRNSYKTRKIYKEKGKAVIVNGTVAYIEDYDSEKAGAHMLVEALVSPKLNDPELMGFYGVEDALEMPNVLFRKADDFSYINECVLKACGLDRDQDEEEQVNEIKN